MLVTGCLVSAAMETCLPKGDALSTSVTELAVGLQAMVVKQLGLAVGLTY